ncbi:MAG: DUF5687 family protein [Mucilaginibacter sp.]|uniref:DUF5687 family protein n=1 Tax=Mucilaginibacter sp. TaxID=1882438 RepID=UPI003264B2F0
MTTSFIQHEFKAFWRSKNTGKAIAVRVILGLFILYFAACIGFVAYHLDNILKKTSDEPNTVIALGGLMFYYYIFDLLMRFQLQELPTLRVQPYLHLPIKKNTLIRYLSLASLRSFFNLWPFILFTPFIFKVIVPQYGAIAALTFFIAVISFATFNNYLSLYIKRKSNLNGWVSVGFGIGLALLMLSDFKFHIISFREPSKWFFGHLTTQPILALLPLALGTLVYYVNFMYLKGNLYLEELGSRKESYKSSTEFPLLNYFGKVGDLVGNEIKLIFRNKRPRSALVMTVMFLLYGLLFYTNKHYGEGWKVFCGTFMTGVFIINYGQFMFGWQAGHFDGILVSKINFRDFLRAKYLLFTAVSTVAFILTIPYAYFGWHIIAVHFAMFLWNIGVNTTIVLFFANRNNKRIDLSKGASFNWEGVGATQLLIGFPLLLFPYLIYAPLAWFNHPDIALVILGAVGLLFVTIRGSLIVKLEEDFQQKRYTIAEGFRNK